MSLVLNFSTSETCDRKYITFKEATGIYGPDNVTGWGTPNPEIADYVAASADLVITDPSGVSYRLSEQTAGPDRLLVLPDNTGSNTVVIHMGDMGGIEGDLFLDGVYTIAYTLNALVDAVPVAFTTTLYVALDQGAACCVGKMFAELTAGTCCSEAETWRKALKAKAYFYAAKYAARCGKIQKAESLLAFTNKLCTDAGNCLTC